MVSFFIATFDQAAQWVISVIIVIQTAKRTSLRVPVRMDIPDPFFMPDMLCRTKGNLTIAVPLGPVWVEK